NTNKTSDRFKDLTDKGYEIPWQHDEVIALYASLRDWQVKYNPLRVATKWSDLHMSSVIRSHTKAQLAARGESCFLFRDASRSRPEYPVDISRMQNYWYRLLDELERRVALRGETLPNGQPILFIEKRGPTGLPLAPVFDLHSLRVSILTALSVEGGLPLSILSKCVAGHASILMTLYYLKQGPAYISQQMAEAQARMMEREQENYLRFLQDCNVAAAESVVAFNDRVGLRALQEHSAGGWIIGDLGICPVGGAMCHTGGPKLTGENGRNDFQPTPGGPRNCVRCRYFLTGPAFLAGLVAHFNSIGMDVLDCSERLRKMQADISEIEDNLFSREANDSSEYRRLDALYQRREQAMNRLDEVAHNWHATFAMVERSKALLAVQRPTGTTSGGIRLLASEDLGEITSALGQCTPFDLYNTICQHATVYPAANIPVASLRRGWLLDAMLARNDRRPVFAALTEGEAIAVGNELVNFLYARLGVVESNRLVDGTRMLAAAGLADDVDSLLTGRLGTPIKLASLIVQHENGETPRFVSAEAE
ncbi:VPA1269 family protein, partial [Chromobacterium vaccinii]|uniref:VPA1269 family protein n=1 Tax=Chromobacterium vaccinii TaxID=1108595 RepID=UPI000A920270